jgi:cell division protein FtsL
VTTVEAAARTAGGQARVAARGHRSRTPSARARLGGGVTWIVVVGTLLAGVVAINVAVLQLNVRLDRLGTERAQLKADNARLRARLSSAGSSLRVALEAREKLGLRQADPLLTEYVRLTAGDR